MKKSIKVKVLFTALLIAVVFSGCKQGKKTSEQNNTDELSGTISISGAFALYPMGVKWAEEFRKLHPGVKIDLSAGGAGKGMADALSGMIDLGMVSREVNPEEVSKGAWKIAVTKDAVLPVINTKNPVYKELMEKGMTKEMFADIYINERVKQWGQCAGVKNNIKINVYTRSDACGAAEMWGKYIGTSQEGLKGIGVFGDPGIADAVKKDINGIGYNNVIYAYDIKTRKLYDGIGIVPIDINGNGKIDEEERVYETLDRIMQAIQENKYPSPPARDLYFVSKGKPMKKEVVEFLRWILTDGQKYVHETGYVNLDESKMNEELGKLK